MSARGGDLPMHGIDGMSYGNPLSQFMDVSTDRLIVALEIMPPNVLIVCMEWLRLLLFKIESCQTHMLLGTSEQPPKTDLHTDLQVSILRLREGLFFFSFPLLFQNYHIQSWYSNMFSYGCISHSSISLSVRLFSKI
jgi:hypothetical protein